MINRLKTAFGPLSNSKWSRWLFSIVAITFSVLVLGTLIWRERSVLFTYPWKIHWQALLIAFVVYTMALFLASYAWILIIRVTGARVSFWSHFRYFCMSMLAKRLPGTVWYVAYRNQMYQKEGLSVQLTTLASGVEYALLMVSGILVTFLFAIPVLLRNSVQTWLVAITFVLFLPLLHPKVLEWMLKKFGRVNERLKYRDILWWLVLYVCLRLLSGLLVFCIANIIYPISYENVGYVIGGWSLGGVLTNLLIFSPSNMGLTEITFSLILTSIMPSSIAVVIAVLSRIVTMSFELLWAFIGVLIDRSQVEVLRKYY